MVKSHTETAVRRGGRPQRDEVERRQRHLLDTAADMFISGGYAGTSLDRIALAAKVSKATIYGRFNDKAGLFKAVVNYVLKHKTLPINQPLTAQTGVAAVKEQLKNNITASLQPAYIGLFRLFFSEAARFPEIIDIFSARGDAYWLLLEQLERHEEFRDLLPFKEEIAHMLVSMTGMLVTSSAALVGYSETVCAEAEASRMVDICLYGFFGRINPPVAVDPQSSGSNP